jgi:predicted enzyme related to lactoylglutathione lyase
MSEQLIGVMQLAIPVTNIERATAFYRDTLGFRLLMNGPNMAFLDCGGIRLYLDANPGAVEAGKNTLIYFRAENIDRAHSAFNEGGVTIFRKPEIIASLPHRDLWLMWIRDSESNLLGVMEERQK